MCSSRTLMPFGHLGAFTVYLWADMRGKARETTISVISFGKAKPLPTYAPGMFYCKILPELWENEYNPADQRPQSNLPEAFCSVFILTLSQIERMLKFYKLTYLYICRIFSKAGKKFYLRIMCFTDFFCEFSSPGLIFSFWIFVHLWGNSRAILSVIYLRTINMWMYTSCLEGVFFPYLPKPFVF